MKTINPWINFNGNAEEAFRFYATVFGSNISKTIRFKDMASEEFQVSEAESDKIMLIMLPIGGNNVLIANDVPAFMGKVNENENRSKIYLSTESREEADKVFSALGDGGQVEGPMGESMGNLLWDVAR